MIAIILSAGKSSRLISNKNNTPKTFRKLNNKVIINFQINKCLDNNFKKPNFCDIIGSILYDKDLFKIDFLANQSKTSKKRGISSFFSWLDQYI